MTNSVPSSVQDRPVVERQHGDRASSGAAGPQHRPSAHEPLGPLRILVPVAMLVLGLLTGLVMWAGAPTGGGPPSVGARYAPHRIDFNEPATLAWSLERVGPEADALRDVTCSTGGQQLFICHGRSPDGSEATVRIRVAESGTSWASVGEPDRRTPTTGPSTDDCQRVPPLREHPDTGSAGRHLA